MKTLRFVPLPLLATLSLTSAAALAQSSQPIQLQVDATDAPRRMLHAHMILPASGGQMNLFYPKWIPGEHGPTGPIVNVVGMKFRAGGRELTWQRDNGEVFALKVDVPSGVKEVEVEFDFPLAGNPDGFSSASSGTDKLSVISWNQLLLYPRGKKSDDVQVQASLKLPQGWKYGTALPVASEAPGSVDFKPVSLTTLVDSPLLTGQYFKSVVVHSGPEGTHQIDIAADSPGALETKTDLAKAYKPLVAEARALFGGGHYRNYRWLLTLSDRVAHFGLEHHESSDDRMEEAALTDANKGRFLPELLAHEYSHSWNGKFRRPAGLATGDYEQPMRGDLLWVYEGLTTHAGNLLPVRSGITSMEQYRDHLAQTASSMQGQGGRKWRPLADTAVAAQFLYGSPQEWSNARRGVDFYPESELIWLEVDTIIRRESGGKRSLDDFTHEFHGGQSGPALKPYTLDDVVNTLNKTAAYDWRGFFDKRVMKVAPDAPVGGIENAGWKLVYSEEPNDEIRWQEAANKFGDFSHTIGVVAKDDGSIGDVVLGLAAHKAGVLPGGKILAVNGRKFSVEGMHAAIKATKGTAEPLELIVENDETYSVHRVDYHGGERYPHLVRDETKPDLLAEIAKPHAK